MQDIARKTANNASFQAFMNCYLKEIDPGVCHDFKEWQSDTGMFINKIHENESPENNNDIHYILEVQLQALEITLAIGVSFKSLVGRHRLSRVYQKHQNQFNWHEIDTVSAIMLLIDSIYSGNTQDSALKSRQLELISRVIESHQVMSHYIERRFNDSTLNDADFIHSEQSLLFGHWLHPTPKSRQGIHAWQHHNYTPELQSQFQLHFFAINRDLVHQNSILETTAEQIIQHVARMDSNVEKVTASFERLKHDKVLVAVHPLQAQWLLHQDYVIEMAQQNQLIDLGSLGPLFTPTSSVRTVYCAELKYMLKLSIPVKITNSMRINMQHELDAGMLVAKLLRHCGFSEQYPQFKTIDDPAYITLEIPGKQESGFEVIIRDNPFFIHDNPDNKIIDNNTINAKVTSKKFNVQSIAALVQDPIKPNTPSRLASTIQELAQQEKVSLKNISLKWFDAYWECAIESAIRLYDSYGIALEAHQQNSLLDVSDGYPKHYYYRDNQGFYLSKKQRQRLLKLEPQLQQVEDLFYDDEMICDRFSYYLIVNQLFSVINRFALDNLVSEVELLNITYKKLEELQLGLNDVGVALIDSILHRKDIPCKGNLLTRIEDVDELQVELELAVYTTIKNPFYQLSKRQIDLSHTVVSSETLRESA